MTSRFLLDTHVVLRWLTEPKRLSRVQARLLDEAVEGGETVAVSSITLMEVALLFTDGRHRLRGGMEEVFHALDTNPVFQILPLSTRIAADIALLAALRDPADRAIVATARVHRLRLLTSDQRIIECGLVSVVD